MVSTATDVPASLQRRPVDLDAWAIYVEADEALFRYAAASWMRGDVHLSGRGSAISADEVTWNQNSGAVSARGNVYLKNGKFVLRSQAVDYNLNDGSGEISQTDYLLNSGSGRGSSARLVQHAGGSTEMHSATYTTCPPGVDSWRLEADRIVLDHETEQGKARNVRLKFMDTTVLYLPGFSFPLSNRRKSGLLTPGMGTSEKSGLELAVPYYFNLAPNYDLTTTPHLLSKRGIQIENEFRYLFNQHEGQLDYALLPHDNQRDGDSRYYFNIDHNTHFAPERTLTLKAEGVSDTDYFNDLGSSLASSSIVTLERTLEYTDSSHNGWYFSALAQSPQVLDSNAEAYARLPQLNLTYEPATDKNAIHWKASAEYARFTHSQSTNGQRADLALEASRRYENSYAWLQPAIKLQHTSYWLDRDQDNRISRTLPTAAVDYGLIFERPLKTGNRIQTLEPRIFYTYTPFRNQDDIPVFDSSEKSLSYSQLFSSNRFTGKDRIADANRLSSSLTTRIQDPDKGREVFRASIGQMRYFADRRVTLPDSSIQTSPRSELVLETAGELNDATHMTATAFVDTRQKQVSATRLRLNYRDHKERILNLGYSKREGEYEAAQFSFATPVTDTWKAFGAYEADLENGRMLEVLGGFEYGGCCWNGRMAARKYLISDNQTYDDALFLELELKGLGDFGNGTRDLLKNRIYGYE
ncbi:MAG: LPS-assembly protein LptD [Thiothrix sp.]|nr:LPS-assembly protein LptD [Thiothrix sp.]HPQ95067.1 LPS-assembly protein LptD [Thiolinea sp.]